MKKYVIMICAALVLVGCSSKEENEMKGTGTSTNKNNEVTTAEVEFKGDTIEDVDIDETAVGKNQTKKELKDAYNMLQASPIKKEWYQQVEFFEEYVEKHGIEDIKVNGEGKAENNDIKSGCTISVDGFIKAIENAKTNATKED